MEENIPPKVQEPLSLSKKVLLQKKKTLLQTGLSNLQIQRKKALQALFEEILLNPEFGLCTVHAIEEEDILVTRGEDVPFAEVTTEPQDSGEEEEELEYMN